MVSESDRRPVGLRVKMVERVGAFGATVKSNLFTEAIFGV